MPWPLAIGENTGFFCIDLSFVLVYFYVGSGAQANQGPPPHLAYCRLCDLITSPSYPQILQVLRRHFPDLSETQGLPDKFIQPVGVVSWNRGLWEGCDFVCSSSWQHRFAGWSAMFLTSQWTQSLKAFKIAKILFKNCIVGMFLTGV